MLLTASLFFLASFIASDQSITRKEKAKCIFSNLGNLPRTSRKICSPREITAFHSKPSSSSGADCSPDKVRDAVAGIGAVLVKKHSQDIRWQLNSLGK